MKEQPRSPIASLALLIAALVFLAAILVPVALAGSIASPRVLMELWADVGMWSWFFLGLFAGAAAWTIHWSLRLVRGRPLAAWALLVGPVALVGAGGLATLIQVAQVQSFVASHSALVTIDVLTAGTSLSVTALLLALLLTLPLLMLAMAALTWRAVRERTEVRVARGIGAAACLLLIGLVLSVAQGVGVSDWHAYYGQESLGRKLIGAAEVLLGKALLTPGGTAIVGVTALFCALILGVTVSAGTSGEPSAARKRLTFIAALGLGAVVLAGAGADIHSTVLLLFALGSFSVDPSAAMLTQSIALTSAEESVSMALAMAAGLLITVVGALLLLFRTTPQPSARDALAALPVALLLLVPVGIASAVPKWAGDMLTAELGADNLLADARNGAGLPRVDPVSNEPVLPRAIEPSLIVLDERGLRFGGELIEYEGDARIERLRDLLAEVDADRAAWALSADLRAGEFLPLMLGIVEVVQEQALLVEMRELRLTRRHTIERPLAVVPLLPAPAGKIEGGAYLYKVPGRVAVSLGGGKQFRLDAPPRVNREVVELLGNEERITLLVDPSDGVEELLRTLVSVGFLLNRRMEQISVALTVR